MRTRKALTPIRRERLPVGRLLGAGLALAIAVTAPCFSDGIASPSTEPSAPPVTIDNYLTFYAVQAGPLQHTTRVWNYGETTVAISQPRLESRTMSLVGWPSTIGPDSLEPFTISLEPISTAVHDGVLTCLVDGEEARFNIRLGVFVDDGSEMFTIAARAIKAFEETWVQGSAAEVAHNNNRGVLFYLLRANDMWGSGINRAYLESVENRSDFAAEMMNLGARGTHRFWEFDETVYTAYEEALNNAEQAGDVSVQAPRLYYNMAWSHYSQDGDLEEALAKLDACLAHPTINELLEAKARVLKGAVQLKRSEFASARTEFQQAVPLDPDGPIGNLAQRYLDRWDRIDVQVQMFQNPALRDYLNLIIFVGPGVSHLGAAYVADGELVYADISILTQSIYRSDVVLSPGTTTELKVGVTTTGGRDSVLTLPLGVSRIPAHRGGIVSLDGAKLTVPAGALAEDTFLTMIPRTPAADEGTAQEKIEEVLEVGPQGIRMSPPGLLSLPASPAPKGSRYVVVRREGTDWVVQPSWGTGTGEVQCEIEELGTYGLALLPDSSPVSETISAFRYYPNPTLHQATVEFVLVRDDHIKLALFDVSGREVATLADVELPAGLHRYHWTGRDRAGRLVSSGVYFCRLNGRKEARTLRVLVVR